MPRRKPLLIGALAVGAGVLAGLKARRGRAPSLPPPPEPASPPVADVPAEVPPTAEPAADTAPETAPESKPRAKPQTAPKPKAAPKSKAPAKPAKSLTRDELYREAKRLGIEGRSKMSKGELERAVTKASRG
jgi:hypothetical protein